MWYSECMSHTTHPELTHAIQAGVITGFISTAVGIFISIITHGVSGTYYVETSVAAITVSAMSFGIIAGILFHFIEAMTHHARDVLSTVGLSLPTILALFILSAGYYDTTFKIIATSIAYAVALCTVILIPMIYHTEFIKHSAHLSKKKKHHGHHHSHE